MKKFTCLFLAALLMTVGISGCGKPAETQARKTVFPDNEPKEIPQDYLKICDEPGTVLSIKYETKDYRGTKETFEKHAMVYLPYGYNQSDETVKYNVMYMMHGGGGSEKEPFGGPMDENELKRVLDHMIKNGDMEPCIFVGLSYNNPHNGDATTCCKNFAEEFVKDVIPAVECQYNTYLSKDSSKAIKETRLHRGFSGFSMGAACTWWIFEQCLEEVGYFAPVAGDSWCVPGSTKQEAAEHLRDVVLDYGMTKDDFYIYCGVGTNDDMAGPNMRPMVDEMKKLDDVFVTCDNFKDGNFYFYHKEGGWHAQDTVRAVIFNAVPKFFG